MKKLIGILLFVLIALIIGVLSVPAVSTTPPTESTIYTTEETPTTTAPIATTEVIIETTVETTVAPTEPTTIPTEVPTEPTTVPTEPTELIKDGTYMGIDPLEYAPNGMTNLELLACVIYQEAGWDRSCDTCRALVGDVVLNRVLSPNFPNTIYEVLMQTSQYGSYCVTGVKWSDEAKYDQEGVERAWHIAKGLLKGDHTFAFEQGYVWQARFVQGKGGFWCHNTYFGYS